MESRSNLSASRSTAPDRRAVKRRMTWEEVQPFPGNPLYPRRLLQMRKDWGGYDHGIVGSPAIADNSELAFPDLPEDAMVVIDGNHRRALAEEDGKLFEEFLADLYRGLTRAQVHRLRRGLNDRRTVKPAERFLELVEEGDLGRKAIQEAVEGLGWEISHDRRAGGLPCTNELEWIWHQDRAAMVRAVESYEQIWGRGEARAQARVIKGLGQFWIRYPGADLERLVVAMRRSKLSVDDLYRSGKGQYEMLPPIKGVYDGIRYVLGATYNKGHRTGTLPLT